MPIPIRGLKMDPTDFLRFRPLSGFPITLSGFLIFLHFHPVAIPVEMEYNL